MAMQHDTGSCQCGAVTFGGESRSPPNVYLQLGQVPASRRSAKGIDPRALPSTLFDGRAL
jgi:hypothetical protein